MLTKHELTQQIKKLALQNGFLKVGIAPAKILDRSSYLMEWLKGGKHGHMHWMERYLDKRLDVCKLYPPAKSVIAVAQNYYTPQRHSTDPRKGKISRYAWGRDYHKIMKKKLKSLLGQIKQIDETIDGRFFVDTAPIQDKLWARETGIGWQGKNTNILTRDLGSWIFLGELVINTELEYDHPATDYCGSCRACIEACPTQALEPYRLDATKCISYLSIELRDQPISKAFIPHLNNWIFGCDICQDVCPWNRFARETDEIDYQPDAGNVHPDLSELSKLTEDQFKARFKKSPVSRARHANFMRNIAAVQDKSVPVNEDDHHQGHQSG